MTSPTIHPSMQWLVRIYFFLCLFSIFIIITFHGQLGRVHEESGNEESILRKITTTGGNLLKKQHWLVNKILDKINSQEQPQANQPIPNQLDHVNEDIPNKNDQRRTKQKSMPPLVCSKAMTSSQPDIPNFQSRVCYNDYDCGLLKRWRDNRIEMCLPTKDEGSSLTCYMTTNEHVPAATRPHTICQSNNLIIDFSKLIPAQCLKYRPGYLCRRNTYFNYLEGALVADCEISKSRFTLDKFPNDFGKDIFSSFKMLRDAPKKEELFIDGTTIFVSREIDEHVNMFHASTDFFNTYLMYEFFQIQDNDQVQVVLLDDHFPGPYDMIWNNTFSFRRPMKRAKEFSGKIVKFEKAIFQPAGYASPLLSHLTDFSKGNPNQCSQRLKTLTAYTERIIEGFNIPTRSSQPSSEIIRVLLVSRRPYNKNGVEHSYMGRQIANEDDLLKALKKYELDHKTIVVERVDFAQLSFKEQIQKTYHSDFLIGMHGAGLTHAFWLPPSRSAVLELWSLKEVQNWQCFEQITLWKGNLYEIWKNSNPKNHWKDSKGDYTIVDVDEFMTTFERMLKDLRAMRKNL
ncbi:hypothetical protein FDP41_012806 [Naegleria fowleri]|uniref:EGF domain-specific O-linked N-acetylglucosamine transferase n=1 Tax=Naegleria fowleri TaxID=5763 RepID=A0A6A5C5A0_NAEFO|nr:uncharacterized protein FDP41_012806 [Naegleria fowleri]KAF0981018.1 hypothetical protein FDP41_012806 [Naegleria fowleri]CAG4708259.1 unnamed protein product [Naegleria fowleri]